MQFPQTISKRQEIKYFLKCSISTLLHTELYLHPCIECFIVSQCALHATSNTGRNKVILWEKGWQQNFWLLVHFSALNQELWTYSLAWANLNCTDWLVLSPSLDSGTDSKRHSTCHEIGVVSTYHMWRSQKNIICLDNMVSIQKFHWSFRVKGTTLRYHFIKSLYSLKEQC